MKTLITKYKELIQPANFIKNFDTVKDFEEWVKLGTKEDIDCAIKAFEEDELFECCSIMLKIKNDEKY